MQIQAEKTDIAPIFKIPLIFESLTAQEQVLIAILFENRRALPMIVIYEAMLKASIAELLNVRIEYSRLTPTRKGSALLADFLRKNKISPLNLPKLTRVLNELIIFGWVAKQKKGPKLNYYYLTPETRDYLTGIFKENMGNKCIDSMRDQTNNKENNMI